MTTNTHTYQHAQPKRPERQLQHKVHKGGTYNPSIHVSLDGVCHGLQRHILHLVFVYGGYMLGVLDRMTWRCGKRTGTCAYSNLRTTMEIQNYKINKRYFHYVTLGSYLSSSLFLIFFLQLLCQLLDLVDCDINVVSDDRNSTHANDTSSPQESSRGVSAASHAR